MAALAMQQTLGKNLASHFGICFAAMWVDQRQVYKLYIHGFMDSQVRALTCILIKHKYCTIYVFAPRYFYCKCKIVYDEAK